MNKFIVGGWVRDNFLKETFLEEESLPSSEKFIKLYKEPHDRDFVVVGSTPEEMLSKGFKQVGTDFPVFLDEKGEEYALARKEISTGSGYQDFKFDFNPSITLREDLRRRDFTINALAQKVEDDEIVDGIIDYFGGLQDAQLGIVRHIDNEHFQEDPLRVLRGCRIASELRFNMDIQTIMLCRKMVRLNMLESLSAERVWKEIDKALHTTNMFDFIEFLSLTNALSHVLPEVFELTNVPENTVYHPEGNAFTHVQLTFRNVERMFIGKDKDFRDITDEMKHQISLVNFALLCHDLGKAHTNKDKWPAHHGHDELGLEVIDKLCDRLKVPNEYRDFAKLCCKYHMKFYEFLKSHRKTQYDMVKGISNNFKDFEQLKLVCIVHKCDLLGRKGEISKERVENCKKVCEEIEKIYKIMEGVTLKDLPEKTQEDLSKQKGEKFGKLYRDAMISYLKHGLSK